MKTKWRRWSWCVLLPTALLLAMLDAPPKANAAEFLWISAPNWSYSAAAASSPNGTAYFWGLSQGAGSYSFAYAFSHDPPFGSADAFAEASAGGRGGMGAADAAGIADPYAGVGIDISLTDPSSPSGYPTTDPATDPFSSSYTVSSSGITFTGMGEELNGADAIQAFEYTGNTDATTLENELGASDMGDATSTGDVTDMTTLMSDFNLIPLDSLVSDPGSLSGLTFTENTAGLNTADVILVGEGEAASTPEPALPVSIAGLSLVGLVLFARRKKALAT